MKKKTIEKLILFIENVGIIFLLWNKNKKNIEEERKRTQKFKDYYNLLNRWLIVKQQGDSIEQLILQKGYSEIAIYGMGEIGQRLVKELDGCEKVSIKYAMDKSNGFNYEGFPVVATILGNDISTVDAIIVTPIFDFESIKRELRKNTKIPILSIEELFT